MVFLELVEKKEHNTWAYSEMVSETVKCKFCSILLDVWFLTGTPLHFHTGSDRPTHPPPKFPRTSGPDGDVLWFNHLAMLSEMLEKTGGTDGKELPHMVDLHYLW